MKGVELREVRCRAPGVRDELDKAPGSRGLRLLPGQVCRLSDLLSPTRSLSGPEQVLCQAGMERAGIGGRTALGLGWAFGGEGGVVEHGGGGAERFRGGSVRRLRGA